MEFKQNCFTRLHFLGWSWHHPPGYYWTAWERTWFGTKRLDDNGYTKKSQPWKEKTVLIVCVVPHSFHHKLLWQAPTLQTEAPLSSWLSWATSWTSASSSSSTLLLTMGKSPLRYIPSGCWQKPWTKFTKTLFPCSKPQAACTCRRLTLDFSHQNNWEPTIPRVWDVESSHWNVIQHEGWIQSQVFFGMFMRTTRIHETNSALKPTVTNFKMQRTTNLELSLYKNASKQKAVETWFKPIKASGILEGKKGWNLESSPLNSIF